MPILRAFHEAIVDVDGTWNGIDIEDENNFQIQEIDFQNGADEDYALLNRVGLKKKIFF